MERRVSTFSYDDSDEESSYIPSPSAMTSTTPKRSSRTIPHQCDAQDDWQPRTPTRFAGAPSSVLWTTEERSSTPQKDQERGCRSNAVIVLLLVIIAFLIGLVIGGFFLDIPTPKTAPVSSFSDDAFAQYPDSEIMVGAYYYPWHSDDFHGGTGYLRDQLTPRQEPALGEYDDSQPATIAQHLAWSRQANIRLWVTSWRGDGKREDLITRESILTHPDIGDHKIALLYETFGRIREDEEYSLHRVVPDMEHICRTYFDHPNYMRMGGSPVMFVYLTRKLERLGLMDNVMTLMRQTAGRFGYNLYIVGDHAFRDSPNEIASDTLNPFTMVDAISNYDVYGSIGQDFYAGEAAVKAHYEKMAGWRALAATHDCAFIPSASPGYNDIGVRPEANHAPLSRKLTPDSEFGSLFTAGLREARKLVDPEAKNILMITSFNEWHEDTQIEPTVGGRTNLPNDLTQGVEYEGYGELYLNILRQETTNF